MATIRDDRKYALLARQRKLLAVDWESSTFVSRAACQTTTRKRWTKKRRGIPHAPPSQQTVVYFIKSAKLILFERDYLAGKNGQTIGMMMIDTMKHTTTRPVPALT